MNGRNDLRKAALLLMMISELGRHALPLHGITLQLSIWPLRKTVGFLYSNIGVSAGSIDTIIQEHLLYSKVIARWVPKMLTEQHKQARVSAYQQLLDRFSAEGQTFLERIVTGDETWVHHYTPETKRSSMQWKHVTSPSPRKFRVQRSAGKVIATVFCDIKGVLLLAFFERNHTVTGQHYSDQLEEHAVASIHSFETPWLA